MANKSSNIKIEALEVNWCEKETTKITVAALPSDGESFHFDAQDGTLYYVYYGTTDPAPAGRTGIQVNPIASTIATLVSDTVTAINGTAGQGNNDDTNAGVDACDTASMILMNQQCGTVTAATVDVDTGFTFSRERTGSDLDLGFISGNIEFGFTEDFTDIPTHQTGTQIVDSLRTGRNLENITVTMLERDATKLTTLLQASGNSFTPSGGSEVTGFGSEDAKQFLSIIDDSKILLFHPVANAASDRADDFVFWRAYPNVSNLVFSGEEAATMEVEFIIRPDELLDKEVRVGIQGDNQQDFLV